MIHAKVILAFALMAIWLSCGAQFSAAQWIGADTNQTSPNTWHAYRRSVYLSSLDDSIIANIAVDSKYWLWVNDKLVVYEGGLKRGPNPRDSYYDRVPLNKYLHEGKNTLAILVWFWGGLGFSHHSSGRSGLLFEMKNGRQVIISDTNWKTIRDTAYGPSISPKPNFRLSEPNIFYDARKAVDGWMTGAYSDRDWPHASVLGPPPMPPWNHLVARNIPLFKFDRLTNYTDTVRHGDTLVCKLPYNGQFSPYFKIKTRAGQRIFMATDTWFLGAYPGDSLYTICSDFITKEGTQEYESYGWISGHEMIYVFPEATEILELKYRETGYDSRLAGSFESDDNFLNLLWKKAQRTLYLNMRDNYMDCPDRERAQWAGDASMEMLQSFYALDRTSDQLSRKLFLDLANWQRPDSIIYNPVPESGWKLELPAHSLAPFAQLWNYFLYTRDTSTVSEVYPALRKYLALWTIRPSGQLVYRKGGWDWGDWGENIDFVLIQHGWYLLSLQVAEKIARLENKMEDAAVYTAQIKQMKSFLNSSDCWNGQAYRYKDYTKATDDRANALMVIAGVVDTSKWKQITKVFNEQEHASPWMEKFVLESLIQMGHPDLALERMKKRFREMVNSKYSTLWEIWEHKEEGYHGNSGYNHGWAGGPLFLLSAYYAGIRPDETVKDLYRIQPLLTGPKKIATTISLVQGSFKMKMDNQETTIMLDVSIPKGIQAEIMLPLSAVSIDGLRVNGSRPNPARLKTKSGSYCIMVGSGRSVLICKRRPS